MQICECCCVYSVNSQTDRRRCLPRTCKTYRVKQGDTCLSVRKAHQLGSGKLASYNPTINKDCTNLIADDMICVDPPGGYAKIRNVPAKPKTTSEDKIDTQSVDLTEPVKLSKVIKSDGLPAPSPTPSGTSSRCTKFALSKAESSCASFAEDNTMSLAQLYAWNGVFGVHGESCNKFEAGMNYCTGVSGPMRAPGPFQRGVVDTCVRYEKSSHADTQGDKCVAFALRTGIALSDLYAWNKILKSECKRFLPNEYYCVAVAGPLQEGVSGHNKTVDN